MAEAPRQQRRLLSCKKACHSTRMRTWPKAASRQTQAAEGSSRASDLDCWALGAQAFEVGVPGLGRSERFGIGRSAGWGFGPVGISLYVLWYRSD